MRGEMVSDEGSRLAIDALEAVRTLKEFACYIDENAYTFDQNKLLDLVYKVKGIVTRRATGILVGDE